MKNLLKTGFCSLFFATLMGITSTAGAAERTLTITACIDGIERLVLNGGTATWQYVAPYTPVGTARDDCPTTVTEISTTVNGATELSTSWQPQFNPYPPADGQDSLPYSAASPLIPTTDATVTLEVIQGREGLYLAQEPLPVNGYTLLLDFDDRQSFGASMYTARLTFQYQDKPLYSFSGFAQPVDNPPTLNAMKAGSAVPVKFSLGGDKGLNILSSGSPTSQQVSCSNSAASDAVEQTVTAGSSTLTYDAATQQYIYVWKTDKSWAGTCRQLNIRLADDTVHPAVFKFTK